MSALGKNIILTHPLRGNYGGMLQAWALMRCVSSESREGQIADYFVSWHPRHWRYQFKKKCALWGLRLGISAWGRRGLEDASMKDAIQEDCAEVFKRQVSLCPCAGKASGSAEADEESAWVVGSDQVWRAIYGRALKSVPFFFLDFLPEVVRRRSIAYAASFGTDEWEGTPEETTLCRELLQQFKAVSVREHSGVRMCREVFGVEAVQMPDPTMLMTVGDYEQLMEREKTYGRRTPYVAAYLLDESEGPLSALRSVADKLSLPVQHLTPHVEAEHRRDRLPLSVPQWLRYMKAAECVVTDSFHGCVFAIMFNKPFVCLGNAGRGSARFDTLLSTYGLESRLVMSTERAAEVLAEPIHWDSVNAIRERERERGLAFLRDNLS